jgi:hypothetical protein
MSEPKRPVYVEYVPLSKLQRAPRNPKAHDLGLIERSMGRFGYVEPIAINEKTGRLVAGHGRLDALEKRRAAGAEPPERVIVQNGEWCVPVLRGISFESDADTEAYLLASNQITIAGGWLDDELAKVLGDLAEQDGGLEGVGFEQDDIDELLRRIAADAGPLTEDDPDRLLAHARELQERWQTAERQLWVAGPHRIYCGHSEMVPAAFFGKRKIRLTFCDPPWGVNYSAKARVMNEYKHLKSTIERDIANDDLDGPRLHAVRRGAQAGGGTRRAGLWVVCDCTLGRSLTVFHRSNRRRRF